MTAPKKKPDGAEQPAEQPSAGGSYVRKPDGSLERVEFTDDAPIGTAEPAAPAAVTEQEG